MQQINPYLLTQWTECPCCKGGEFKLDLTLQQGDFLRFQCVECKKDLCLTVDVKVAPNQAGGIHAHVDWVQIPTPDPERDPEPRKTQPPPLPLENGDSGD